MTVCTSPVTTGRDLGVDLLRAVSILYIVGYWHLIPYTTAFPGYANGFTEALKYLTLATFVFCSGWLLAGRKVELNLAGLWDFYRRRLVRIYPLYALALVLFSVFGLASWRQLTDAALLISMFHPPALPTLWFVTMIMLFYLIAPVIIRAAVRPLAVLLVGAAVWLLLAAWHAWLRPIDLRVLLYWPVFVFAVLYRVQPGIGAWLQARAWRLVTLVALSVAAVPLSATGHEWAVLTLLPIFPLVLCGPVVCFLGAGPVVRWLSRPLIQFFAYSSFGLYLFHRPVFAALIALYFPATGGTQLAYLWLIGLPVAVLIGAGLQAGYERLLTHSARQVA